MSRPRFDGSASRATIRKKLTDAFVSSIKPDPLRVTIAYDTLQIGFAVTVQSSGSKSFKALYYGPRGPVWYHIGRVNEIGLSDARKLAAGVMLQARSGRDPQAEKTAQRSRGSFRELATAYVEQHAKKHNKSWAQADRLITRYADPRLGSLQAATVSRADVKGLLASVKAPVLANQILASISAVFTWAIREQIVTVNPAALIDRNPVSARERILSSAEYKLLWDQLDGALRLILLTGARPGEVSHMRTEHVTDNVWVLPGAPDPKLNWPGTKNSRTHSIPLSKPAMEIIEGLSGQPFAGLKLDGAMRAICKKLGVSDPVKPHDLRRSALSMIAGEFGSESMDRRANHSLTGVTKTYNRFDYAKKDAEIMTWLGSHIIGLVEGKQVKENVLDFKR
jgi:integrase